MGEVAYDPMSYAWRVLLVLALVFAGALWVRSRWRSPGAVGGPRRRLHVVDSLALGPQRHLYVIESDGRRYLIGVTPQQISFLTALGDGQRAGTGAAVEGDEDGAPDFQAILEEAEGGASGEDSAT